MDTYGYRDVKVNVWVPCDPMLVSAGGCLDPSRAGLVAEIQLHIQEMYDVKHEIGSWFFVSGNSMWCCFLMPLRIAFWDTLLNI